MPTAVSELLASKFENTILKLQLVQMQAQQIQQTGQQLVKERDDLLQAMRAEVGAGPADPYDPKTRTFTAAQKPPLSTPPSRQAKRARGAA